jgi:hypothetical protein
MKRILGGIVFLLGLILAGWIGYNLFIERLPETKGRNPLPAIILSGAFLFVGYRWMRRQQAG